MSRPQFILAAEWEDHIMNRLVLTNVHLPGIERPAIFIPPKPKDSITTMMNPYFTTLTKDSPPEHRRALIALLVAEIACQADLETVADHILVKLMDANSILPVYLQFVTGLSEINVKATGPVKTGKRSLEIDPKITLKMVFLEKLIALVQHHTSLEHIESVAGMAGADTMIGIDAFSRCKEAIENSMKIITGLYLVNGFTVTGGHMDKILSPLVEQLASIIAKLGTLTAEQQTFPDNVDGYSEEELARMDEVDARIDLLNAMLPIYGQCVYIPMAAHAAQFAKDKTSKALSGLVNTYRHKLVPSLPNGAIKTKSEDIRY